MRRAAWLLLFAWLSVGLWLLATAGWARIRAEARAPRTIAAAWGGGALGAELAALEPLLAELRARGHAAILLVSGPGANAQLSLATHRLYPTHVIAVAPQGRGTAELLAVAERHGAGALLVRGEGGRWIVHESAGAPR